MKRSKRYKFTIEDESRLRNVVHVSMPIWKWVGIAVLFFIFCILISGLLICLTPIRSLLPGYLKSGQRAETEMNILRLDSLNDAYMRNENYLKNMMTVLDTERTPTDSASVVTNPNMLPADSLSGPSPIESKFVAQVREHEKFNIAVIAPLAADAMMFAPVAQECVFTPESRAHSVAHIILAKGESPTAIADGRVVGVFPSSDGGFSIMIQHLKGFLSLYSHLGTPLASPGDEVTGGQIIALPADRAGIRGDEIYLRMWHNGTPLIPFEYIGEPDKWRHDISDPTLFQ